MDIDFLRKGMRHGMQRLWFKLQFYKKEKVCVRADSQIVPRQMSVHSHISGTAKRISQKSSEAHSWLADWIPGPLTLLRMGGQKAKSAASTNLIFFLFTAHLP